MYLSDKVAQSTGALDIDLHGRSWSLPGAASFSSQIEQCLTRYVLLDDVQEAICQLAERWGDLLDPGNTKLRAPMDEVWIEWSERESSQQAGILVTADADGRSGRMRLFWTRDGAVDVAQADVLFDFDHRIDFTRAEGRPLYNLRALPPEYAGLRRHLAVAIDACWADYFRATSLGPNGLPEVSSACGENLWPDVIRAIAFFMLLASRTPFVERAISRERLNAARAKAGKAALLDHVELRLGLAHAPGSEHEADGGRKFPRMHMVRGHLVRRGDSVFWRAAHVRGSGAAGAAMPAVRHVRMG